MADPDPQRLAAIVAPLATVCEALRFTYSWRLRRRGDRWIADCAAGFPRIDGRLTGPHPRYRVEDKDPEAALTRAVKWARDHAAGFPNGYSPPAPRQWG